MMTLLAVLFAAPALIGNEAPLAGPRSSATDILNAVERAKMDLAQSRFGCAHLVVDAAAVVLVGGALLSTGSHPLAGFSVGIGTALAWWKIQSRAPKQEQARFDRNMRWLAYELGGVIGEADSAFEKGLRLFTDGILAVINPNAPYASLDDVNRIAGIAARLNSNADILRGGISLQARKKWIEETDQLLIWARTLLDAHRLITQYHPDTKSGITDKSREKILYYGDLGKRSFLGMINEMLKGLYR